MFLRISNPYFILILFTTAYILSFIDRFVMAVLVKPIQIDFGISDFEYSFIHGLAFSLLYTFIGIPIGWLADRHNRKNIIAVGVAIWSVMTFTCGLAVGFWSLFFARVGVGIGEAALSPPAHSILTDTFSKKVLPVVMSIFTLGIPIGIAAAYSIGYEVLSYYEDRGGAFIPILGEFRPWQLTLMVVGLPGVVVAALIFLVIEPERKGVAELSGEARKEFSELFVYLKKHKQIYLALFFAVSSLSVLGYGFSMWYPEHVDRVFGVTDSKLKIGVLYLKYGVAGTLFGAILSGVLARKGRNDGSILSILLIAVIWLVPAVMATQVSDLDTAYFMAKPCIFLLNAYFGVSIASLQLVTPNQFRSQVSAVLLFMTNVFGAAIGPVVIGFLSTYVYEGAGSLGDSLSLLGAILCPVAIIVLFRCLKPYRQLIENQ